MAGHRSTLKKSNKSFKSGHSSKRSIKAENKGKIEKKTANTGSKAIKIQSKNDRKNLTNQLKQNKILKALNERKLFTNNKIEKIVTVLPLTKNLSAADIINQIFSSVNDDNEENLIIKDEVTVQKIKINRFKTSLKIILPDMNNLISILDSAKISDFVILGFSSVEEIDSNFGEQILRSIESQGISTVFGVIPDLLKSFEKKNFQLDIYKSLNSYYKHFFPNNEKLFSIENKNDSINLLRSLCQKFPKSVNWRNSRGYLIADYLDYSNNTLIIEGTVRGTGFNENNLIHIPDFGDFQIERIEKLIRKDLMNNDEHILLPNDNEKEGLSELIEDIDENEDLEIESMEDDDYDDASEDEDIYDNDDDWNLVDEKVIAKRTRLPKGISEYQAKWLREEEIEALIRENGLQSENEEGEEKIQELDNNDDDMMIDNDVEIENDNDMYVDLPPEEEAKQLSAYKQREREELEFPDEIELRPEDKATKRLSKYRGVKSLATCIWDYDEKDERKPLNWKKFLRIRNYRGIRNKYLKDFKKNVSVTAGDKVSIYIKLPEHLLQKFKDPKIQPFIIYSLLNNEHKLSVCNFTIQTWESYDEPIKSKEPMIVQYGFRRYTIKPLFSQPTRNPNNVARFQRFLHKGQIAFATAITPVSFTNSPALFFKKSTDGSIRFLAQGTFANTDFTRILAKRIVLTGDVCKMHKSVVTVRYMFFNSEDVAAYQNVPIFTKMGRSGFIKDSLGTHGYFKAAFDAKLNAQDIVAMELFKRVWPEECLQIPN